MVDASQSTNFQSASRIFCRSALILLAVTLTACSSTNDGQSGASSAPIESSLSQESGIAQKSPSPDPAASAFNFDLDPAQFLRGDFDPVADRLVDDIGTNHGTYQLPDSYKTYPSIIYTAFCNGDGRFTMNYSDGDLILDAPCDQRSNISIPLKNATDGFTITAPGKYRVVVMGSHTQPQSGSQSG